jgi:hypothetical protein
MTAAMEQQHTTPKHAGPPPSVLRVVEGLHQGARVSLQHSGLAIIGSADDCDLILVDSGVAARHAAITLREHDVTLRAIDGKLEVDGRSIVPGEVATLATGTPILIGGAKIVIGTNSDDFEDANSAHTEPDPKASLTDLPGDTGPVHAAAAPSANESAAVHPSAGNAGEQGEQSAQAAAEAAKANARGLRKVIYTYTPWLMTSRGKQISAAALGVFLVGALFAASMTLPAKDHRSRWHA